MKLLILVTTALIAVHAQRVNLIDGIRIESTAATSPVSERIVTRPYSGVTAANLGVAAVLGSADQLLFVEGQNLNVGTGISIALAGPGVLCRDIVDATAAANPCTNRGTDTALGYCSLTVQSSSANKFNFILPTAIITQASLRYADKICLRGDARFPGATPGVDSYVDTELLYQVVIPCLADATSGVTGATTASTRDAAGIVTFAQNCANIAADNTITEDEQTRIFRTNAREQQSCVTLVEGVCTTATGATLQIDFDLADRRARTRCCGFRAANVVDTGNGNALLQQRFGVCYDPNVQSCCSGVEDNRRQIGPAQLLINVAGQGRLVNKFQEKCCFGGTFNLLSDVATPINTRTGGIAPLIRLFDQQCPCLTSPFDTNYCQSYEACCKATKITEFNALQTTVFGSCYDPRRTGCCDTGATFNSGTQQCCKISGVQSLDIPCPCATNAHCDLNQACCKQYNLSPSELAMEATRGSCDVYTNYFAGIAVQTGVSGTPFGQDRVATGVNNRCLGQCLDTRFAICCNGNPCIGAYERCCNDTCCNKITQSCVMGQKPPVGGRFNDQNVGLFYEICTTTEALIPLQAVLAFFLPIMLLFVTLMGLAFTLYFSKKQNALNPLSGYEKAITALSFLIILFAWPLYFSPLWKYGVIAIWTAFFSILTATCGVKRLLPAALVLQIVLLIYIFDPFGGNEILNLSYTRPDENDFHNNADSGLFLSIMGLWRGHGNLRPGQRCTDFYAGWFVRDPLVEDQARLEFNGVKYTYGYCAREYIATLMIVEILMSMWVILLTVVTLVTFIKNVLIGRVVKQNPFHM